MTLTQAADMVGQDRSTLFKAIDRGALGPSGNIGGGDGRKGVVVVRRQDLREYAVRKGLKVPE